MSRSSSRSRNNLPPTSARIRIANEIPEREHDREGPLPSSLSLLSARRPSWAPAPYDNHSSQDRIIAGLASYRDVPTFNVPNQADNSSSPEIDGGNFRRNLHIDMKDLVGDAVGNMSISPVGRDIVLAARRGLFIIDLEAPLEVPRFLPQGGTWEVADVQWNPHHLRAEYIVSTSSEKLLIWNLAMPGNMSIQHILRSHYRAITDINWHTFEPDLVSSVGIDSWIWTWDLRETRKPVLGLCAFNAGGTQVKWNRQNENVLASSHMDEVLIWDRRKGSLPTARIRAHSAKIYGIDWAHARVSDIVTCSLDKSIKVWNVKEAISTETAQPQPLTTITTRYPVWRARDLPFGRGVLSLPQRGETILEMWAEHNPLTPAEVFAGHEDVVKEFVWRRGSTGGEYQLITWSKDRTLRFWHVGPDIMEKFGCKAGTAAAEAQLQNLFDQRQSFRHPPQSLEHVPTLSAPIGSRSILAEVRAGPPQPPHKPTNPVLRPHHGSAARGKGILLLEPGAAASSPHGHTVQPIYSQGHRPVPIPAPAKITRGKAMGGRSAKVDPIVWLSSVKVENRRDESSSSRVSSASTASPQRDNSAAARNGKRKRSPSKVRENKDGDGEQSLWPEITSVLTKLASSNKIRLEKNDLTKRRTCTIGLHGPWGESSSVFVRVSFRFPKGYPHAPHPEGTPEVELERTPLISRRARAIMRKKLRALRERHRPCLEACLRFLLFGDEDDQVSASVSSESSSEDEDPGQLAPKSRNFTAALLRNNKSLAKPRTSQGVFGPNGELVCFFWSPPRGSRNSEAASSANNSLSPPSSRPLFQPPSLLSDAVRRLALAAVDQQVDRADFRRADESDYTVRIMTNLLTFSAQKSRRNSDSHLANDGPSHCIAPVKPACRSTVYIRLPDDVNLFRRKVASEYIFDAATLPGLCAMNARIAREHGQFSHERVFRTLESLFPPREAAASFNIFTVAGLHIIEQLHKQFSVNYDIQMLAMIAVVFLKAYARVSVPIIRPPSPKEPPSAVSKTDDDYFSLPAVKDPKAAVLSPGWQRLSSISPTGPSAPAASLLSTSNSSRGSWSSLFNTGSVRQLMSGVPESITSPLDTTSPRAPPVPIPIGDIIPRLPNPDSPRRKALGKDPLPSSMVPLSKSWSETHVIPLARPSLSQSSSQGRRPTFSQVINVKQTASQKKLVIFDKEPESKEFSSANVCRAFLQPDQLARLACHIISYAEVLLKWKLDSKRLELLNAVKTSEFVKTPPVSQQEFNFDIQPTCKRCGHKQTTSAETCSLCGARPGKPSCSICRLPVKGLSIWCGHCLHISHVKCWRDIQSDVCGSGCGCLCSGPRKPSSRRDSRIHSPSPLVV